MVSNWQRFTCGAPEAEPDPKAFPNVTLHNIQDRISSGTNMINVKLDKNCNIGAIPALLLYIQYKLNVSAH